MRGVTALALVIALARSASAGVYFAAERVPFTVDAAGTPAELPYEPRFKQLLDERLNALNPAGPLELAGKPTFRGTAVARANGPDPVEAASYALRAGDPAAAVNRLAPLKRRSDFVVLVTLAHAHAARAEWTEAVNTHAAAFLEDAGPPPTLPGATPDQTKWLLKLERTHYARWLALSRDDAAVRDKTGQGVLDLFPGVRFAPAAGPPAPPPDLAKLPPDAVAVVQQLLLWAPNDGRLLWLLGELYAATGRLREAEKVIKQCTEGRGMTSQVTLTAHRRAVEAAVAALPPERETELPPDDSPADPDAADAERWAAFRPVAVTVGAGVGLVTVLMVALQIRAWRTRRGRR